MSKHESGSIGKVITIDQKVEILNTKLLYEGVTQNILVNKFYDYHGQKIDQGHDTIQLKNSTKFKIVERNLRHHMSFSTFDTTVWDLILNGKTKNLNADIVGYKVLKDKLVLSACVGAG